VLSELGIGAPLLVAGARAGDAVELPVRASRTLGGGAVAPHRRTFAAEAKGCATGNRCRRGRQRRSISARAVSAATELPLVSVPTTYAGAEWTTYYGVRDPERKMRGGGSGARPGGIVYDVDAATLDLAARADRRDGDERARALRRGALRARPQSGLPTSMRSQAHG